jgi:ribonuclease P protein component
MPGAARVGSGSPSEPTRSRRTRGKARAAEGLGPEDRIRRRSDYLQIQKRGRRLHTRHFIILVLPNETGLRRIGVTVTKKVSSAVGRNRVKRLVREVFRRNRSLFPEGSDVVLIARDGAASLSYALVLDEMRGALEDRPKRSG